MVSARLLDAKRFFSTKRVLDFAWKIYEVLAARKTYLITPRVRKNKHTSRMLESARKDHIINRKFMAVKMIRNTENVIDVQKLDYEPLFINFTFTEERIERRNSAPPILFCKRLK